MGSRRHRRNGPLHSAACFASHRWPLIQRKHSLSLVAVKILFFAPRECAEANIRYPYRVKLTSHVISQMFLCIPPRANSSGCFPQSKPATSNYPPTDKWMLPGRSHSSHHDHVQSIPSSLTSTQSTNPRNLLPMTSRSQWLSLRYRFRLGFRSCFR